MLKFLEASAGTGKTFTVVRMAEDFPADPEKILITSFTKSGVAEIKKRIEKELRVETIHSFCYRSVELYSLDSFPQKPDFNNLFKKSLFSCKGLHPMQLRKMLAMGFNECEKRFKRAIHSTCRGTGSFYQGLEDRFCRCKVNVDEIIASASDYKGVCDRNGTIDRHLVKQLESLRKGELSRLLCSRSIVNFFSEENVKVGKNPPLLPTEIVNIVKEGLDNNLLFKKLAEEVLEDLFLQDVMTHSTVLKKMEELLNNPKIVEEIRNEFELCIVDEFQDVDPLQWKILYTLFHDKMMVVGDPKQAVYGFRGGSLETYLESKKKFNEVGTLDVNYRCNQSMLNAVNKLFLFPKVKELLSYRKLHCGSGIVGQEKPLVFAMVNGCYSLSVEKEYVLPYILSKIVQHSGKKIGILVKDRYQGSRLKEYLLFYKISTITTFVDSVISSRMFGFVELILDLLDSPRSISLSKEFLLYNLSNASTVEEVLKLFYNVRVIYKLEGRRVIFKELLKDLKLYGEDLVDFLHLEELLLRWDIEELRDKNPEDFPELQRRSYGSEKVEITTTHSSKGKEYDIVISLGTSTSFLPNKDSDREKMNLFYVAVTRAKEKLYLIVAENKNSDTPLDLYLSLVDRKKISAEVEYLQTYIPDSVEQKVPDKLETYIWPNILEVKKSLSYTSLSKGTPLGVPLGDMPQGKEVGRVFHLILERIIWEEAYVGWNLKQIVKIVEEETIFTILQDYIGKVLDYVTLVFHTPIMGESLVSLDPGSLDAELYFESRRGDKVVKGYVDLLVCIKGSYYILDWKLNSLVDYTKLSLEGAMRQNDYFLQAKIYFSAFRHLSLRGIVYFFVRGGKQGLYSISSDKLL